MGALKTELVSEDLRPSCGCLLGPEGVQGVWGRAQAGMLPCPPGVE